MTNWGNSARNYLLTAFSCCRAPAKNPPLPGAIASKLFLGDSVTLSLS